MNDNAGITHFFCIIALIFATTATIVSFTSTTVYTNTPADEVKIEEMVKDEIFKNENRGAFVSSIKNNIIKQYYSKEIHEGFSQTPVKILLTISGASFILGLYFLICGVLADLKITNYLEKKAAYWDQRAKKEDKILQELIQLQRKISTDK